MNNTITIETPAAETIARYADLLTQVLAANGWKKGSAAAKRAEYAFLQGIAAALGKDTLPYVVICLQCGRSILD